MKRVLAFLILLAACAPRPAAETRIRIAVQQTVAALSTQTPYPPPPTPTPLDLKGLFCEYQFCIGHPPDMAFFDVNAQRDPTTPSTYSQGWLAAYNAGLFIQVRWQDAPAAGEPRFMLDLVSDPQMDERRAAPTLLAIGELRPWYAPIATQATPLLPFGGVATWTCGGRAFAWKAYTPHEALAPDLLKTSLERFRCDDPDR